MRKILLATTIIAAATLTIKAASAQEMQKVDCVPTYSHAGTANYGFRCGSESTLYVIPQRPIDTDYRYGYINQAAKVETHKTQCRDNPAHCETISFGYDPAITIQFGQGLTATGIQALDIDDGDEVDISQPGQ